jgi:hypothetical protein
MRNLHTTVPEITHRTSIDALERVARSRLPQPLWRMGSAVGICPACASPQPQHRSRIAGFPVNGPVFETVIRLEQALVRRSRATEAYMSASRCVWKNRLMRSIASGATSRTFPNS